ncbi:MAG: DUF937 domain-containing protein [Arcobacter sp.]|nr:DUF937 domain-containing protein [Arcobacter sp.]
MDILNMILSKVQDENLLESLSAKTGIDKGNLSSVISELAPKLVDGAKENIKGENDSSNLINMMSKLDIDELNQDPDKIDENTGKELVGELFASSNENEEEVVQSLSSKTGLDSSSIASLLPMVAPLVMGALSKQTNLSNANTSDTNGLTSMLTNFLDKDNDGSVVDDVMDMAKKFF